MLYLSYSHHRISPDCRYRRRSVSCNCFHHSMLAWVQRNEPLNQIKTVNVPSTSTLNASADKHQLPASNIQTVNLSENNIKYSPSVLIELLDGNGMWRKAVALLDSGKDVTLIKRNSVQKFHRTSNRKPFIFKLATAGGASCSENSATISLQIRRQDQPPSCFNTVSLRLNSKNRLIIYTSSGNSYLKRFFFLNQLKVLYPSWKLPSIL